MVQTLIYDDDNNSDFEELYELSMEIEANRYLNPKSTVSKSNEYITTVW
jgi:hypothetical protein